MPSPKTKKSPAKKSPAKKSPRSQSAADKAAAARYSKLLKQLAIGGALGTTALGVAAAQRYGRKAASPPPPRAPPTPPPRSINPYIYTPGMVIGGGLLTSAALRYKARNDMRIKSEALALKSFLNQTYPNLKELD